MNGYRRTRFFFVILAAAVGRRPRGRQSVFITPSNSTDPAAPPSRTSLQETCNKTKNIQKPVVAGHVPTQLIQGGRSGRLLDTQPSVKLTGHLCPLRDDELWPFLSPLSPLLLLLGPSHSFLFFLFDCARVGIMAGCYLININLMQKSIAPPLGHPFFFFPSSKLKTARFSSPETPISIANVQRGPSVRPPRRQNINQATNEWEAKAALGAGQKQKKKKKKNRWWWRTDQKRRDLFNHWRHSSLSLSLCVYIE